MNLAEAESVYVGNLKATDVFYGSQRIWPSKFHAILESSLSSNPANGSLGHSIFPGHGYKLSSKNLSVIGFKLRGHPTPVRIKNGKVTTDSGIYNFGVDFDWSLIRYFPTSDINITADGIGRSTNTPFVTSWSDGFCGFYLNIPESAILTSRQIFVDYEYQMGSGNGHAVAFWSPSEISQDQGGGLSDLIGTIQKETFGDSTPFYGARLSSVLTETKIVAEATKQPGVMYRRRVIVQNKI
jgi:hypothetical protein